MLEMKVRAAEVLSAGQDALLVKLSPKQIAALRFASDASWAAARVRGRENLSAEDVKASIRTWRQIPSSSLVRLPPPPRFGVPGLATWSVITVDVRTPAKSVIASATCVPQAAFADFPARG